jgi:isopenicillin-N N-acyltransferase-like protein
VIFSSAVSGRKIILTLPIIDLKGTPYAMGLTHGRALASHIEANFNAYVRMIQNSSGLTPDAIRIHAKKFLPEVELAAPQVLEEMQGIADGAGVSLETVLVINARSELAFPDQLSAECTVIGLSGSRTISGHVLMAQNWDWIPAVKHTTVFFRIRPQGAPRMLMLAEAGQVGKLGFNEAGLGLMLNLLIGKGVCWGVPTHVLLRQVLSAATIEQAAAMMRGAKCAASSHMLLGETSGNIIGLEVSPAGVAEIRPTDGIVLHTNHFCDAILAKQDLALDIVPDTTVRLSRATSLCERREKWDAETIREVLTDHANGPSSICRHIDPQKPEHARMETLVSLIFNLDAKTAWVAHGQPCRSAYDHIAL